MKNNCLIRYSSSVVVYTIQNNHDLHELFNFDFLAKMNRISQAVTVNINTIDRQLSARSHVGDMVSILLFSLKRLLSNQRIVLWYL